MYSTVVNICTNGDDIAWFLILMTDGNQKSNPEMMFHSVLSDM